MSVADRVHESYVHSRRVRVLSELVAAQLPREAIFLDVGCGDGLLARAIMDRRPDVSVRGIDVLVRRDTHVPVTEYDGTRIPFQDGSVDAVLLVDVLHHTHDPMALLAEAKRVARRTVIIKDHLLNGMAAGPTLRFMDRVGNARHHVALPHNYWPRARWKDAIAALRMRVELWEEQLGLYPPPADWCFGRSLHFVARLDVRPTTAEVPEPDAWESAYARFETPNEETGKFRRRLERVGARGWARNTTIVELFCGRGNGMRALQQLGFTDVTGIDLSASLLSLYCGPASTCVADCRQLPLADGCKQVAIVQGGLHHLVQLPRDLDSTLHEIHRVLEPDGRLVMVEPWLTPFLSFVHAVAGTAAARRLSAKIDALAAMIEHERVTYEQWLAVPDLVLATVARYFETEQCRTAWGKLVLVGRRRQAPEA